MKYLMKYMKSQEREKSVLDFFGGTKKQVGVPGEPVRRELTHTLIILHPGKTLLLLALAGL